MSWKNLKTLALVLLVALNVIFAIGVTIRYSTVNYYSSEEKTLASRLLAESGIIVPPSILGAKKKIYSAYSRELSLDELEETAEYVFKTECRKSSDGEIETEYLFGKMTLSLNGEVKYLREGAMLPADYMTEVRMKEIIQIEELRKSYEKAANDFFNVKRISKAVANRGALKTSLSLYRMMLDEENGRYIALFTQSFGSMAGSGKIYMLFDGENVLSCDGELAFLLPKTELKTENADLLDLLFKEKRAYDDVSVSANKPQMTVSVVYYSYAQYYEGEVEYYVPVCNILYSDGTLHGYFLTNGEKVK